MAAAKPPTGFKHQQWRGRSAKRKAAGVVKANCEFSTKYWKSETAVVVETVDSFECLIGSGGVNVKAGQSVFIPEGVDVRSQMWEQ